MHRLTAPLLAILLLGGCAALQRDAIGEQENQLSAAGFKILPASSPERQRMLAELKPNRLTQMIQGDQVSYLYADPINCHCLYAGGQDAFGRYQAFRLQQRIADEQITAAQLNWSWGPWGGFGYW